MGRSDRAHEVKASQQQLLEEAARGPTADGGREAEVGSNHGAMAIRRAEDRRSKGTELLVARVGGGGAPENERSSARPVREEGDRASSRATAGSGRGGARA